MDQPDFISRELELVVRGQHINDGTGLHMLRLLTHEQQQRLDPFLLLDEFSLDESGDGWVSGFPDHPHRGFETITYLQHGRIHHRDCAGGKGVLQSGDVQWITAGRGLVHAEMPEDDNKQLRGFQLWLNLPARQKLCKPQLRNIAAAKIPLGRTASGNPIHIIAGHYGEQAGAMLRPHTEPLYLDIELSAGSCDNLLIPSPHNALVYVYAGAVTIGRQRQALSTQQMGILSNLPHSDGVSVSSEQAARLLLIAGKPLGEPIVQWGPFVMNSRTQIDEAIEEYRSGQMSHAFR